MAPSQQPSFEPGIFRRYDIRGRVDDQITPELAYHVGRAFGTRVRRAGATNAVIGRDVRHSSPALAARAAEGMAEAGVRVIDIGVAPTPVVYHAAYRMELGGAIVVTGSHNPKTDNGLKLVLDGQSLWGDAVASLRTQIEAGDYETGDGSVESLAYVKRYVSEITDRFVFKQPLRVAIDCGNGVMGPIVLDVLHRLGCEVVPLYTDPDGDFPNHLPDPEVPAYMRALGEAVVEKQCHCGLGFDGDGDRVGVFDETGRKISADWLIVLFAEDMLREYPGGKIRYDVKCSQFLADRIRAAGGEPIMGETGHSLLKRDIRELDAIFGGELSGHLVFNRGYLPIDDSLYCALAFLERVDRSGGLASRLFHDFPALVSTPEIKVPCPDDRKFDVVDGIVASFEGAGGEGYDVVSIDGVRAALPSGAWFLIRASNTTPCLTVRLEANDAAELETLRAIVDERLARFDVGPLAIE